MDGKTRQLVQDLLAKAHAGAWTSVLPGLERLSEPDRDAVARFAGEFRECLRQTSERLLRPSETTDRLAALIHGHPNPEVVRVMKTYAEAIQILLVESRDGLRSPGRRKGH